MKEQLLDFVAKRAGIQNNKVESVIELFDQKATIPFIARYRKELTGYLDEIQLQTIENLQHKYLEIVKRKEFILTTIKDQNQLTDLLKNRIESSMDLDEIEDLYLPYKKKRQTRAEVARKNGLEPLAKMIMAQKYTTREIKQKSLNYKSDKYGNTDEIIKGAQDIIAEWINENAKLRKILRNYFLQSSSIFSSKIKKAEDDQGKFRDYYDFDEALQRCPSHRLLAMLRGEKLKVLKIRIYPPSEKAIGTISRFYLRHSALSTQLLEEALLDAYKRLILPSLSTQTLSHYKEIADLAAIDVFSANLQQLLLNAPLGEKSVMALDPGFRTGCKLACIDQNGNLTSHDTIYPNPPQNKTEEAADIVLNLLVKYNISNISIGNGTAGKETMSWLRNILPSDEITPYMVNENGASIYSASQVARDEFPHLDLTVRGAISIGRRLQDPLAELVKIAPKSIGVGQYQHDVNQSSLQVQLDHVVVSCVNKVGINLNTASQHLLIHVAGLGPTLAKNIVIYRKENGAFKQRKDLLKVPRMGQKAFEQCAGFLRIKNGTNPLDNTGIHPERYTLVKKMALDINTSVPSLIKDTSLHESIHLNDYLTDEIGLPTLRDIIDELSKPGLDPRGEIEAFSFDKNINVMEDLSEGMELTGIVSNITKFGAFVDIGIKQDGLVHISEMADKYISDPLDIVHLNQKVKVTVKSVDIGRQRIQLSMKSK